MLRAIKTWLKGLLREWARYRLELDESHDVRTFHVKFGLLAHHKPIHLTRRKLHERVECLEEEVREFRDAVLAQDLGKQADALIDLVYFAKGTAVMMGLPWETLWDDVHRANMMKERGISHRGHKFDCVKPPNWIPPLTDVILYDAGYRRYDFINAFNMIDEARCYDDPEL